MFGFYKKILSSPMFIFVYGILAKWYITIAFAGVVVAFWVFKGLEASGVLEATENVIIKALEDTKSVAKYCVPKITKLSEFWDCLESPPKYTPDVNETKIQEMINQELNSGPYHNIKDPYE